MLPRVSSAQVRRERALTKLPPPPSAPLPRLCSHILRCRTIFAVTLSTAMLSLLPHSPLPCYIFCHILCRNIIAPLKCCLCRILRFCAIFYAKFSSIASSRRWRTTASVLSLVAKYLLLHSTAPQNIFCYLLCHHTTFATTLFTTMPHLPPHYLALTHLRRYIIWCFDIFATQFSREVPSLPLHSPALHHLQPPLSKIYH